MNERGKQNRRAQFLAAGETCKTIVFSCSRLNRGNLAELESQPSGTIISAFAVPIMDNRPVEMGV